MYRQSIIRIFVKALILATCATYFSSVFANEKSDLARLDEILSLSDRDNQKGLKQLEDFKKELSADSSDVVRLTTLKNLVGLYYDAGQSQSAHVSITEFLQLAERLQNKDALALGKIFDSSRILNSGKPELALEKLMQVKASVKDSKDPEVNMRLNAACGRVYNVAGKFELSLTHNLEALRFADLQKRRRIQAKMSMLGEIAELYTSMNDPEKALATTKEALLLSPSSSEPKILASLANTQGLAYALLGKNNNAIDAFQRSLKFGIDAKVPGVEALALVNIGYHYLLVHDYIKAEKFSRLALPKVEAINNKTHIAIAKINIGLALGGQGKINQGVVYINDVIQ